MMMNLHDYVKRHYMAGDYQEQASAYRENDEKVLSDYELGYQQATYDHEKGRTFRIYPYRVILLLNKISGGRLFEIVEFIRGYQDKKHDKHYF